MRDRNFLKNIYRSFDDFVTVSASRELEYFILDSKFTTMFNSRMKQVFEEIKKEGKDEVEFSVIFNTDGEVAIINSEIIGKFIGNSFKISMEQGYKEIGLNKIVKQVVNGNEKIKKDFVLVSFDILYKILREIYSEIKCKREIVYKYKSQFHMAQYEREDIGAIIAVVLILEDICKYIQIDNDILLDCVGEMVNKKNIK